MKSHLIVAAGTFLLTLALPLVIVAQETPQAQAAPAAASEADESESGSDAKDEKEELQRLQKEYEAERLEAKKSLDKLRKDAPFQESEAIALPAESGAILGFCVRPNGGLAVISGKSERYGADNGLLEAVRKLAGSREVPHRVQWLDEAGKVERSVELDFPPRAINIAPDGLVYVAGQGKLAVFNDDGKELTRVEAPHMQEVLKNRDEFAAEVMERHEADLESMQQHLEQFKMALQEIEDKPEDQRSKSETRSLKQTKLILASYAERHEDKKKKTKEQLVEAALLNLKEIYRVAVSKSDVYMVTKETSGYGFCVWRLNPDLGSAKKIVSSLAGCCGQMDIQCVPDGIAIAENSRHRVVIVDREGKNVATFGKGNRTDPALGFSSCCNPMNTCLTANGKLLTSECNGLVKEFNLEGEMTSICGVAQVDSGCKNSSIGISPKGDRLYYFDVERGRILVLTKAAG